MWLFTERIMPLYSHIIKSPCLKTKKKKKKTNFYFIIEISKINMDKLNNANNNCRFCLRIFDDMEERLGITSQISDEFRNITQTEVRKKIQTKNFHLWIFVNLRALIGSKEVICVNWAIIINVRHRTKINELSRWIFKSAQIQDPELLINDHNSSLFLAKNANHLLK